MEGLDLKSLRHGDELGSRIAGPYVELVSWHAPNFMRGKAVRLYPALESSNLMPWVKIIPRFVVTAVNRYVCPLVKSER